MTKTNSQFFTISPKDMATGNGLYPQPLNLFLLPFLPACASYSHRRLLLSPRWVRYSNRLEILTIMYRYAYSSRTMKQCHRDRHRPEPVAKRTLHVRAPAHLCCRPSPGYCRRGNRPAPTCRFFGRDLGGPTTIIWSSRATDPHTGSGRDMFRDLRGAFYGMD